MQTFSVLSIAPANQVLTPAQKEFNRLTKKIEMLRLKVKSIAAKTQYMHTVLQVELLPLVKKFDELRADMVRLLDNYLQNTNFNATEKKKIKHLIREQLFELIEKGFDDLKPIYERYNNQSFEEAESDLDLVTSEMMRSMASMMFGIEIDPDADVSTPEKMQAYVDQKITEKEAAEQATKAAKEERRRQKPLTEKQQAAEKKRQEKEQKKQEEANKITKSVRDVYTDLVKAFHPDLEQDETEKARKTAIMKDITAAYEENDLLKLLQLQLQLERIDQAHLEGLAEDRLKLFNKVLRAQVNELQEQLYVEESALGTLIQRPSGGFSSFHQLEWMVQEDKKTVKRGIDDIETDLNNFQDLAKLRAWLKTYRIPPKQDDFDMGDMMSALFR